MPNKFQIINGLYKHIFKPLAFLIDAEVVHDSMTRMGESLEPVAGILPLLFAYRGTELAKTVLGVKFNNPIGLAAGFDYDGHLAEIMKSVGFGFNTVGTVTALPYEGNPKPRLGRLPHSQSLMVNKGFKSDGAQIIRTRLDRKRLSGHTVGVSISSSNLPQIDTLPKIIKDYLATFSLFRDRPYVKYFELNISCPNTRLPEPFTQPVNFTKLTQAVAGLHLKPPIFVKMPNEIDAAASDQLVAIALKSGIRGFIFSNLVKKRSNPALDPLELRQFAGLKGNFSGKPAAGNANRLLAHTRKKFGSSVALIGCGGVFNSIDAVEKFAAGADLIQLITGMIFEGPQIAGHICHDLAIKAA